MNGLDMPHINLDLNPISHITVDAIGEPGERVFYLQGKEETNARFEFRQALLR